MIDSIMTHRNSSYLVLTISKKSNNHVLFFYTNSPTTKTWNQKLTNLNYFSVCESFKNYVLKEFICEHRPKRQYIFHLCRVIREKDQLVPHVLTEDGVRTKNRNVYQANIPTICISSEENDHLDKNPTRRNQTH